MDFIHGRRMDVPPCQSACLPACRPIPSHPPPRRYSPCWAATGSMKDLSSHCHRPQAGPPAGGPLHPSIHLQYAHPAALLTRPLACLHAGRCAGCILAHNAAHGFSLAGSCTHVLTGRRITVQVGKGWSSSAALRAESGSQLHGGNLHNGSNSLHSPCFALRPASPGPASEAE